MAVKKSNDLSYNGKGISIIIKNDIKPCETPKSKPKRKRTYNKKNTSNNNNSDFLDKNNNQIVDSKIPIYRDLFNRNPNNIPQPPMVDWQAIRMGLLPAPPQPPQILPPPPPTQTPNYNFNMPTQPDPYGGMAKLMEAMRPLFLTNNPYNTDYDNGGPSIEDYVSQTNNEDILLQQEALKEAEDELLNESIDAVDPDADVLTEDELTDKKLKLQYEKLIEKTRTFGKGRLKSGATNSSNRLNKPSYLFSDEYMNAYNANLTNIKDVSTEELDEKNQEMTNLNERIRMVTEAVNREKLRTEKKILIKKQKQLETKLKKIADLENYIAVKTTEYERLFPAII